ncbi:alcohol dehydrogenase, partial [Citrobacter freundii]
MSKVVVFNQPGDADVLTIQDMPVSAPRADEVQIRVRAIGINRAEIMYRTGQYIYQPKFPARL